MVKKFFYTVAVLLLMLTLCSCGISKLKEEHIENSSVDKENTDLLTESPKENITKQKNIENEQKNLTEPFNEELSVYNNPIDRSILPIIYSEECSEAEIREAQDTYKELWIQEFNQLMKTMRKKCIYPKDKKDIDIFEKKIESEVEAEIKVITTELVDSYKVNPDPKENDAISRMSLWGNGTRSRLNQVEGQIYRDACMRIINIYDQISGEKYEFRKSDYSSFQK